MKKRVDAEEMIALAIIKSVRCNYPPSRKQVSHACQLKIPMQPCKSLHSRVSSFRG